jgi:protein-disulfide isomerase
MNVNRRLLLAGTAFAALFPTAALAQTSPDLSTLNNPPEIGEMVLGQDTAKVTLIEYASASCPHCASFANEVLPTLIKEFVDSGKLRLIFREFPHNDAALGAFMLARCAPKEKYFPIVEVMFKTQAEWVQSPLEGLKNIALQAGFTEDRFMQCLRDETMAKQILAVRDQGTAYGVEGIPTFFLNGVKYEGERTLDAFRAELNKLLGT